MQRDAADCRTPRPPERCRRARRRGLGGRAAPADARRLLPLAGNGFVLFDDDDYITRNAVVQGGLTLEGARLVLTRSYAGNWFPLTWLSHMLDVELFGLDPRGHHLVGLALHAAAAVLLLLALRAATGPRSVKRIIAILPAWARPGARVQKPQVTPTER